MRCFQMCFFLAFLLFCNTFVANGKEEEGRRSWPESGGSGGGEMKWGEELFLLRDSTSVVKTDAGEMKVVKGFGKGVTESQSPPMRIGFITMKPHSLFIPQYLDSSLILFIRSGNARIGHVHKDALAEKKLKSGDIYRIGAGSAFYIANDADNQTLDIVVSIDTSESLTMGWRGFVSFFIGGGTYPTSILSGFDPETLAVAFNVSIMDLKEIMTTQHYGPIVFLFNATKEESSPPSVWSKFLNLKEDQRLAHLKRVAHIQDEEDEDEDEEDRPAWYFKKLMLSVFGNGENAGNGKDKKDDDPKSYNIFDREADFNNNYGWSKAVDQSDYTPLRHSGMGVYQVSLIAGSMMAPHVNPRATEFGIVLKGTGTVQIVFPNGTLAMNAKVSEGDVFWVPRYFPFCQIAARTGPFEFFGFTTSSRKNRPQFLVGSNSLLHTFEGPEIAAAFGVDEKKFEKIIDAQKEGIILPSSGAVAPPEMGNHREKGERKMPKLIKNLGSW